ncbi:hypothetical protein K490DRAFT_72223 [Saccharata proteae CBS 121410]|uniref:DUF924-domain-containing protein n=1 Tax=Saccharata proteae CBS 121410 TaxID=1314787 RepID=A0A6A5YF63_9PEZI|nr:hypothetical protein K490DRAFT_72223 [Saccharata proteae CBS 121410]
MSTPRTLSLNRSLFNRNLYKSVRDVWFSGLAKGATAPDVEINKRWFGRGSAEERQAFDDLCASKFGDALESLQPEQFPLPEGGTYLKERANAATIAAPFITTIDPTFYEYNFEEAGNAALGLILLLDQMPRNIYRGNQSIIYNHYDRISRAVLYHVLTQGFRLDQVERFQIAPVYGTWFYIPLMHSEYLEDHRLYLNVMTALKSEVEKRGDAKALEHVDSCLGFEKKHCVILEKFGRYPHRNEALGRETTEAERVWLESGGDTFGTDKKKF